MDVQPSTSENAMLIFVTGTVRVRGRCLSTGFCELVAADHRRVCAQIGSPDANPLLFSEMFQLVANGPGSYYVHNQVHRLNYGP